MMGAVLVAIHSGVVLTLSIVAPGSLGVQAVQPVFTVTATQRSV